MHLLSNYTPGPTNMSNCKMAQIIFVTHIIMMASCHTISQKKVFVDSLSVDQKKAYDRISKRRMIIYLFGGLFGALVARILSNICNQALAILVIQMLYYIVYPWPEYMKDYLTTPDQQNLWKSVQKSMNKRYMAGLFVGGISTFF